MLKDEFEHLMNLIRQGAEGKVVNLHEVFRDSLALFEHMKEEFQHATPEEKKELMQMIVTMNNEIMEESKKIMKNSGMTEDQLLAFSENPSNFSPEQWKEFQDSKSKIHEAGMDLLKEVKKIMPTDTPIKPHTVQPIKKKEHPGTKKSRKSDWRRS